jgi:ferredoxin-thioredoxin reductase catalytic subunit
MSYCKATADFDQLDKQWICLSSARSQVLEGDVDCHLDLRTHTQEETSSDYVHNIRAIYHSGFLGIYLSSKSLNTTM